MGAHAAHAAELGLDIIPVADLTIERTGKAEPFAYAEVETDETPSARRLKQIEALVLPPNWQDVRIARSDRAHIQAVGRDKAGRLQYRYHDRWDDVRNLVKTARLIAFGRSLPKIRERVERDLRRKGFGKTVVTATAVRLIDRQLVRPGNEQYAKQGTTGASTLAPAHVKTKGGEVASIEYKGKSGKAIELSIEDRQLRRRLTVLKRRNRKRIFRYGTKAQGKHSVGAAGINAYLRAACGRAVSAKDFRTFGASAMAIELLCDPDGGQASSKSVSQAMKAVSERLRNTPAVVRSSYVHPSIVSAYEAGDLDEAFIKGRQRDRLSRGETALMRFLEGKR